MKTLQRLIVLLMLLSLVTPVMAAGPGGGGGGGGGGSGVGEADVASNNLSYPVIWSEGVTKVLPGTPAMTPVLGGTWWYQWGTNGADPDIVPASCAPDPDETDLALNPTGLPYCNDGIVSSLTLQAGVPAADNPLPLAKAYLQKDAKSVWQAWNGMASAAPDAIVANAQGGIDVNWIDWGDNLESVDWYTRSQVRTEVVLFQDLLMPLLEYEMRHTSGWGIDEVHGMATDLATVPMLGPGTRATVYSNCARLTIQKLLVPRDDPRLADLIWMPGEGWTEPEGYLDNLINPHIFNGSVHEGGDGPGYYSAEINVKGRVIYGYTWNVRQVNDLTPIAGSTAPTAAGDYRVTFSLDEVCGTATLATYFINGTTQIVVPIETEEVSVAATEAEEDEGGGTAVLVPAVFDESGILTGGNLTYIDVRILARSGGGSRPNGPGADDCAQFRAHVQQMEQQRTQWQSQCPGDNCPCTDLQGDSCQQFQTQLMSMVTLMQHLQFRTFCDGNGCQCICQSGDDCTQMQTQLQTLMQTQEQLMTQCSSGECEAETVFFDNLSVEMASLASLLGTMDQEYHLCLPTIEQQPK